MIIGCGAGVCYREDVYPICVLSALTIYIASGIVFLRGIWMLVFVGLSGMQWAKLVSARISALKWIGLTGTSQHYCKSN